MTKEFDVTPTWECIAPALIHVIEYADNHACDAARAELQRMARIADKGVKALAVLKEFEAEFGEAIENNTDMPGTDTVDAVCRLWPYVREALDQ